MSIYTINSESNQKVRKLEFRGKGTVFFLKKQINFRACNMLAML